MIHKTEVPGDSKFVMSSGMRELGFINRAADPVQLTPNRPGALILDLSTGRGLGAMVPRPTSAAHASPTGTSVYLYYDKHDILLYVGITDRGIWRNREHDASAEWWPFVARQEVQHLPTRDAALQREKQLIMERRPPFNSQHNRDHEELKAAYLGWQATGPADVDVEALARQMNKSLPLIVTDIGAEDRFALKTLPEHCAIAHRLDDLTGTLVVGPRQIGRVIAQQNLGIYAFILVERKRSSIRPALGSAAVAPIRFAGGGRFRLAQIEITTLAGG